MMYCCYRKRCTLVTKNVALDLTENAAFAVTVYAIATLPAEAMPPLPIKQRFIMDKLAIERSHVKLNAVLNEVVQALNAHNIPHVLLKGQGVAQNYPHPTSRTCGDIDLYVGEKYYNKANEIILSINRAVDGEEGEYHKAIEVNGIEIKVHRQADLHDIKSEARNFLRWTKEELDNHFLEKNYFREWNNNGTNITLAPASFDSIFILNHMFRHMVKGGVGLRQLCDWTMYIHSHRDEININNLLKALKKFKLDTIWPVFESTAHDFLGLPINENIIAKKISHKKTENVIKQILFSRNFGMIDTNATRVESKNYISKKWNGFKYKCTRYNRLFPIFPKYIIIHCTNWFSAAFVRFIKRKGKVNN